MQRIIVFILFSFVSLSGYAQQTIEVQDTYYPGIIQKYHVLKSNDTVKQGPYQAYYKRKTVIAHGSYSNGNKIGMWRFYNPSGKLAQIYNFDTKQLSYWAKEEFPSDSIQYEFIPKPLVTDSLTLPIKVGGLFFGYVPYLNKFKVSNTLQYVEGSRFGVLQLLISPSGRLAECLLLVNAKVWTNSGWQMQQIDSYELKPEQLKEEDKLFIPATINRKNVAATIYIYCQIGLNGRVKLN